MSKDCLENIVQQLRDIYGEVTVHQGNEHDYLGMVLTYNRDQKTITLSMRNYVRGIFGAIRTRQ
jgi:hypothetical protein